jgi:hypothetical protein
VLLNLFIGHFVRPWQIWQKIATVSLPHKLYHYTTDMRGKYGLWKTGLVHAKTHLFRTKIANPQTPTPNYPHNSPNWSIAWYVYYALYQLRSHSTFNPGPTPSCDLLMASLTVVHVLPNYATMFTFRPMFWPSMVVVPVFRCGDV